MSEPLEIDVYWSFRSPWSYLATRRLRQWQDVYDLQVNFKPVYPIAIRTPEFFQQVNPQWFPYFMTDVFRVAEYLELPFVWPQPDPVVQQHDAAGHWGVPTCAFRGEPFFGQDRLDVLLWRLQGEGLKKRSSG